MLCFGSALFIFFAAHTFYTRYFLPWNEKRNDLVRISDRGHKVLPDWRMSRCINLVMTNATFWIAYDIWFRWTWQQVNHNLLAFALFMMTRCVLIYFLPLRQPRGGKLLHDPIMYCLQGQFTEFRHDLFVSGHISSLTFMVLTSVQYQPLYIFSALVVGICMILSRIHYTIDILIAPYVVYGTLAMTSYVLRKIFSE